jgi:HEAT repeat protein
MPTPDEIPFRQMLDALLDEEIPFNPRYLYRLSDLSSSELSELRAAWEQVSLWRRQALLEDLEILGESDYLLSFDGIGRLGLMDQDPQVRATAIRLLWEYEDQDLARMYLDMVELDNDPKVRAAAAAALGKFVYLGEVDEIPDELDREVEECLLRVTQGQDEDLVRRRALESLGFSNRKEVPPLIQVAFDSGQRDWVSSSLYAMGRSANEVWREHVLSMISSTFPSVRMEAARAAGELELSEATPGLLELLDDDNVDVRSAAIWSLSQIGGAGVRTILEEMQEQTDDDEEAEFLITALDNLDFTEEMAIFTLFDISGSPRPVPDSEPVKKPSLDEALTMLEEDDYEEEDDLYYSSDDDLEDEADAIDDDLYFSDDESLEDFEDDPD